MSDLSKLLREEIDLIKDDEKFMEAEYDTVHEYCRKHGYQLRQSDLEIIIGRGLEDSYSMWKQTYIEELWSKFGDIPMNPETECIETEWSGFPVGTHREEIWHWFEETFDVSVAEDLMKL